MSPPPWWRWRGCPSRWAPRCSARPLRRCWSARSGPCPVPARRDPMMAALALCLVCADLGIGARTLSGALTSTDAIERSVARAIGRIASNLAHVDVDGGSGPDADANIDSDEASPDGEWPKWNSSGNESGDDHPLPPFTEKGRGAPAVEALHRIPRSAGWSMRLLGGGQGTVEPDICNAAPRDAPAQ